MQTTVCFDFGNTRLKCALFHDRNFVQEYVLETGEVSEVKKQKEIYKTAEKIQPDWVKLASLPALIIVFCEFSRLKN